MRNMREITTVYIITDVEPPNARGHVRMEEKLLPETRETCRTNYLRPQMLLTLTGARLVDRSAFLVLVVAGADAATSGAGEYEVVHDARQTGRWRL